MDSYSKIAHLEDEEPTANLRNHDLLSIGDSDVQSHAQFMIDEPIDAQLRFDLGSLDTRDLLDTQEPRENHWEFVGRGQGSEDDAALLEHVKQDGSRQINTKLFADPQDSVNEIPDLFATKANDATVLVDNAKVLLSSSASWISEKQKQQTKGKVQNGSSKIEDSETATSHITETLKIPQSSVQTLSTQSACEDTTCVTILTPDSTNALTGDSTEAQVRKYVAAEASLKDEGIRTIDIHSSPAHARTEPQAEETSLEYQMQKSAFKGEDGSLSNCTSQKMIAMGAHDVIGLAEESTLASPSSSSMSHSKDDKMGCVQDASLSSNLGATEMIAPDSGNDMSLNREAENKANDGIEDSSVAVLVTSNIEKEAAGLMANSADKHNATCSHPALGCGQESVRITNNTLEIQGQVSMSDVVIADQNTANDMTTSNETNSFVESSSANRQDILAVETLRSSLPEGNNKEESVNQDGQKCTSNMLPALLDHMPVGSVPAEYTKKPASHDVIVQEGSQQNVKWGDTTILPEKLKESTLDSNKHREIVSVSHQDNDDITNKELVPQSESGGHEDHQIIGDDKNQLGGNLNDVTPVKSLGNDRTISQEIQNTLKPNNENLNQSDIVKEVSPQLPIGHTVASTATTESPSHNFASTIASDVVHSQVKGSKRKVNKLMDGARSSPVQVRSDEDPKVIGKGESGGHKGSPSKSGSSSQRRRKGITSSVLQDNSNASLRTQAFEIPSNVKKSVLPISSVNQNTHSLPDLNVGEALISANRFNEQQQVQLRAQILVYGSLIQGGVPEEALMVTAFSSIPGVLQRGGNDLEGSARAAWENIWRAAVERIHPKSSDNTLKNAPGFLSLSARAADGSKVNSNSGASVTAMEGRNVAVLNSKPQENWGRTMSKGSKPTVLPNSSTSMGAHSISSSVGEAYVKPSKSSKDKQSTVFLNPSTSMATHVISSPLGEPYLNQSSNPYVDLHQNASRTYFSTPSGPYPAGSSQWIPPFPGPWVAQTQATVHNLHSVFPRPSVSPLNSSQALDNSVSRNKASVSSPSVPLGPILSTSVIGSSSVTGADTVQRKHITTESRPRKRKKTAAEHTELPLNVVPSTCLSFDNSPPVFHSAASTFNKQTQDSSQVSLVTNNSFASSGPLAMVVSEKHVPTTFSEKSLVTVPGDKILDANTVQAVAPTSISEIQLGKPLNFQDLKTHLEEAKVSAEEASSYADSSVLESTSLWSQLKAQRGLGVSSDMEIQLVSSVLAAKTAAAVAKAAAAAARAACEAARQARMIGENALSSNHLENSAQPRHEQDSMDSSVSLPWKMTENCNSIIALAKNASKKRLESTSVAALKAQNFDTVVRAAELAASAVSQVGTVMAMGESVPFTLENLMEVGPEGIEMFLSVGALHGKETVKEMSTGGCDGMNNAIKETVSLGQGCTSSKVNQSRLETSLVQKELQEIAALVRTDQLHSDAAALVRIDQVHDDVAGQVSIAGSFKPTDANTVIQIAKGSLVEVLSDEKDVIGVWFSARVQKVEEQKVLVVYELLTEDGTNALEEWLDLEDTIDNVPRVRLAHPYTSIGFEGTRKRRREAMGSYKWSVGDRVDAFFHDRWQEGEIRGILEGGETKVKVFFPGEGDTSLIKTSMIRPSLLWRNGRWVLWPDIKQGSDGVLVDTREDTPSAKRRKLEKSEVESGNILKQMVEPKSFEKYKGGNHFDTLAEKIDRTSTQDGINRSDQPGTASTSHQPAAKVAFGVPKVAKKRKFMEVSKHYVSSNDVKGGKDVAPIPPQFQMGSGERSKPGSVKGRKLHSSSVNDGHPNGQKNIIGKALTKASITRSGVDGKSRRKEELPPQSTAFGKQAELFDKEFSENENHASTGGTMETSSMFEGEFHSKSTKANEKRSSLQGKRSNSISVNCADMKREEKRRTYKENDRQLRNQVPKSENDQRTNKENEKSQLKEGHNSKVVGKSGSKKLELKDENSKDIGSENSELRRTSRRIQPTSKLLEGLQTATSQIKSSSSHERGSKKG